MKRLALIALVVAFSSLAGAAKAAEDPNGTWKWQIDRNGTKVDQAVKLTLKDGKLTGKLGTGNREVDIEEGTFKDDTVSFKVTRDMGGTKITTTYTGKVKGDTITGKTKSSREGAAERDWTATKEKK